MPDGALRGFLVGLKEELVTYFTDQLDMLRSLNYESCPGEEKCSESETGIIFQIRQDRSDAPIEQICAQCQFLPTKPGQEPRHLAIAIQTAAELNALPRRARVNYPDGLTAFEWTCWGAFEAGHDESEAREMRDRQVKTQEQSRVSELETMRRRGR